MPSVPSEYKPPRIVCRTFISCLGPNEYHLKCWDQAGNRFQEADTICDKREQAVLLGRKWVNKGYSPA